jgi:HEAT repeat protein
LWWQLSGKPRAQLVLALGLLDSGGQKAVPILARLAQDGSEELGLRWSALWSLRQMAATAKPSLPALIAVLRNADDPPALRDDAIDALVAIGAPAVSALVKALEDKNWDTRLLALHAIGALGPTAKPAIPALTALTNKDKLLARAARFALKKIRP